MIIASLFATRLTREVEKISGYIESDEVRVGSRVGGRIAEVLVHEGERTTIGQSLLTLEPYDLQQRLAEADLHCVA